MSLIAMQGGLLAANTSAQFLYWRINITAAANGAGYASLAGLEFRATPGGPDQCYGGTPLASSSYPGLPMTNAFDHDNETVWATNGTLGWIRYQFPGPVSVAQVAIISTPASYGWAGENLKNFTIQRSSDGSAWVTVKTLTNQVFSNQETKLYSVP